MTARAAAGTGRRPWARADVVGHVLFAAGTLAALGYLLHLGRRTTFFYDEWTFIRTRRDWRPGTFLHAHNGHFSAVPVLVYHLLFATAGLRAYLPYRLVLLAFHAGTCFGLYRYGRHRLGPLPALLPPALLLLTGPGYQDLLWPFQIGFVGALGFGVAGFLALDGPPGGRRDLAGCLCLLAAVASSGVGVAMLAGALVRVLLRRQWRRWWVAGVPSVLFLAWYAGYGSATASSGSTAAKAYYVWRIFRAAVGALTGHPATRAVTLATVLSGVILALVVGRLAVELHARRLPVDLLAAIAVALVLFGLTAATRAQFHDWGASRYAYTAGFAVLLVLIEALRGLGRAPFAVRPGLPAVRTGLPAVRTGVPAVRTGVPAVGAGVLALATAASVWTGLQPLRHGARDLTDASVELRADLAALQLADPAPDYQPNRRLIPFQDAGTYLAAVRALGSPALPVADLPRQPPDVRDDADRVLREAGDLTLTGTARQPGGTALPVILAPGAPQTLAAQPGCLLFSAEAPARRVTVRLRLGAAGLTVNSPATVRLAVRRFGPQWVAFAEIPAGRARLLRPRADAAPVPWTIQLSADAPVRACSAG